MKSVLTLSPRKNIQRALTECRQQTLKLVANIDRDTLIKQSHADFSPIGWHLGHIAFTEAYWILERLAGLTPLYPEFHKLFAADGLPKAERQNLPTLAVILEYLATVRNKTLNYLAIAPIDAQQRLWWWLIQHESQHNETIAIVKQLHRLKQQVVIPQEITSDSISRETPVVTIPPGEFVMGSNEIEAQDNERPPHSVYLDRYSIDAYPVTNQQYREFILSEGYQNPQYWSPEGWQWLQKNSITLPLYWSDDLSDRNQPVCGVSFYEAEAYAKFVNKKLPTEAEWEKAAQYRVSLERDNNLNLFGNHHNSIGQLTPVDAYPEAQTIWGCYDMLGNVWEWTNSWFAGYAGFDRYPYEGYSEVYFDNQHRVLKGGSYVTSGWAMRNSFRNWYHPWVRQIFAGFRCAKD